MPQLQRAARERFRSRGGGMETTRSDHTLVRGRGCASHFSQPQMPETVDYRLGGYVGALAGTGAISAFDATVHESVGWSVSTGR